MMRVTIAGPGRRISSTLRIGVAMKTAGSSAFRDPTSKSPGFTKADPIDTSVTGPAPP